MTQGSSTEKKSTSPILTMKRHEFFSGNAGFDSTLASIMSGQSGREAFSQSSQTKKNKKKLHRELAAFEQGTNLLYTIFKANKNEIQERVKRGEALNDQAKANLYMLYFSSLQLEAYYQSYESSTIGDFAKNNLLEHGRRKDKYSGIIAELNACLQNTSLSQAPEHITFLKWMRDAAADKSKNFINALLHCSDMRGYVSYANLYRIYWVFIHFTINQACVIANNTKFLSYLEQLLNHKIDIQAFEKTLNGPASVLNILSVAIYALRLAIDVAMIFKHCWFPAECEQDLNGSERAWTELKKRFPDMLNNIVWGVINLVTNYNDLFNISGAFALQIIAGLLIFDMCFNYYVYHSQRKDYMAQLESLKSTLFNINIINLEERESILRDKQALEDEWAVKESVHQFVVAASVLLFASFTSSLIITAPVFVLGFYLAGTLGVAMYMSAGEYGAYQATQLKLVQAQRLGTDTVSVQELETLEQEASLAQQQLICSLAEKTIAPTVLILTFAVSWQIGLVLVAGYAAYKLYTNYSSSKPSPESGTKKVDVNPYRLFNGEQETGSVVTLPTLTNSRPIEHEGESVTPEVSTNNAPLAFA